MSPDMAARIGKLVGNGAGLWLRLQAKYDEWAIERRLAKELRTIPTLVGGPGEDAERSKARLAERPQRHDDENAGLRRPIAARRRAAR